MVGTTGIGKTRLAIEIAKYLQTEIISCDSRQFYRQMEIGTAAPSPKELAEVPHHFIGNLNVADPYSIGAYEKEALAKIKNFFLKHDVLVLVGGSMMYEKAVIEGLNDLPSANPENQTKLESLFREKGIESLQILLQELDPAYFGIVDIHNPRRLFRALDIIWQTGKTYTQSIADQISTRDFDVFRIGISAPREIIYERINHRVNQMVENGLEDEARKLMPYRHLPSLQTVGYAEMFRYFDGEFTQEEAMEEIKKNSRRFAKRQLTWYRKQADIHWVDYQNSVEESLSLLKNLKK